MVTRDTSAYQEYSIFEGDSLGEGRLRSHMQQDQDEHMHGLIAT